MPLCAQAFKEVGVFRGLKRKVQERWGGCQEERVPELVKFQSKLFRSLNLIKDIIKAPCFLKLLPLCILLSLSTGPLRMESASHQQVSLLKGVPRECASRPHWPGVERAPMKALLAWAPSLGAHVSAPSGEGCRTRLSYLLFLDLSLHCREVCGQLTSSWSALKYRCQPLLRKGSAL